MTRINKRRLGMEYEEKAARYLEEKGYQILARNYQNLYGEIDIVAKDKKGEIVYCEIKFRRNNRYGEPMEAVDVRKQRKICKTALYHYARHGYMENQSCRFDVIGIYGDGTIKHIKHAFEYQEKVFL
ncbi:MAG: YraN family protein [Lachnospiraceae bacterium]|nr:YraN family protein [Lachnospiraceae bacterium]